MNPYEPDDQVKEPSEPRPKVVNDDPNPYTVAGKLVLVAAILPPIVGVLGTLLYLPPGRYNLVMLCMPFVLPAVVVFLGGCAICRAFGIRIRKDDAVNEDGRIELAKPEYVSVAKPPKTGYCCGCASEVEIEDDFRCPKCGWPL